MSRKTLSMPALLLLSAPLALSSCATGLDADDCAAFAARVTECRGSAPDDLAAFCEANAATLAALAALDCDLLESGVGMADGWLGDKGENEECTFDWQCEADLTCRTLYFFESADERDVARHLCTSRASHDAPSWERHCDGWGDGDCVDGDRCYGFGDLVYPVFPHALSQCEAEMFLEPCRCPGDEPACGGEGEDGGGCGPDLTCVQGTCRRRCLEMHDCPTFLYCDRFVAPVPDVDGNEPGDLYVLGDFCAEP